MHTGLYTAVRVGYVNPSSNNEGSPSDLKYALESPTDRALALARYQRPRPLPDAVVARMHYEAVGAMSKEQANLHF